MRVHLDHSYPYIANSISPGVILLKFSLLYVNIYVALLLKIKQEGETMCR